MNYHCKRIFWDTCSFCNIPQVKNRISLPEKGRGVGEEGQNLVIWFTDATYIGKGVKIY